MKQLFFPFLFFFNFGRIKKLHLVLIATIPIATFNKFSNCWKELFTITYKQLTKRGLGVHYEYRKVPTRKNSVFGHFSRSACNTVFGCYFQIFLLKLSHGFSSVIIFIIRLKRFHFFCRICPRREYVALGLGNKVLR